MRLLLDTHVLLWWVGDDPRLAGALATAITDPGNDIIVSAVSAAEIVVKASIGKLPPMDVGEVMAEEGFHELPLTSRHAAALADLPLHHRDPFDRMLVAQALVEGLVLVTLDPRCRAYDVPVLPSR